MQSLVSLLIPYLEFVNVKKPKHKYELPQTKVGNLGTCGVKVEIVGTGPHRNSEISSWSAITAIGALVIEACAVPGTGYVGGWALAGDDEYMKVTIGARGYLAEGISSTTGELEATGLALPASNNTGTVSASNNTGTVSTS
ncbi:MAG: hypothetical protein Q9218_007418 [Villophora microphyllina]